MATLIRHKNRDWSDAPNDYAHGNLRLLMDIRDELQALNRVMQCHNVAAGFIALRRIARQNDATFKRRVEAAVKKRIQRKAKGEGE